MFALGTTRLNKITAGTTVFAEIPPRHYVYRHTYGVHTQSTFQKPDLFVLKAKTRARIFR